MNGGEDIDAISTEGVKGLKKIKISDKTFKLGESEEQDKELLELQKIAERETGHAQWAKLGICTALLGLILVINILQPTATTKSPIGIKMCSVLYWFFEMFFVAMCALATWLSIKVNAAEQKLKIKYGVNFEEGDVVFEGKALTVVVSIGFVGGLVAGALGLGGGSIYNPALLTLGVHPKVSGATGMFLVLYSTINSCLINYLNDFLDVPYACWISLFSLLGSIFGMIATDHVVKMTGRQSIMVWVLVFVFVISTISTPLFGGFSIKDEAESGADIYAFTNLCETSY